MSHSSCKKEKITNNYQQVPEVPSSYQRKFGEFMTRDENDEFHIDVNDMEMKRHYEKHLP